MNEFIFKQKTKKNNELIHKAEKYLQDIERIQNLKIEKEILKNSASYKKAKKILLSKVHFQKWPKLNLQLSKKNLPHISGSVEFFAQYKIPKKSTFPKNSASLKKVLEGIQISRNVQLKFAYTLISILAILPAYKMYSVADTSFGIWTESLPEISIGKKILPKNLFVLSGEVKGITISANSNSTKTNESQTQNLNPKETAGKYRRNCPVIPS